MTVIIKISKYLQNSNDSHPGLMLLEIAGFYQTLKTTFFVKFISTNVQQNSLKIYGQTAVQMHCKYALKAVLCLYFYVKILDLVLDSLINILLEYGFYWIQSLKPMVAM